MAMLQRQDVICERIRALYRNLKFSKEAAENTLKDEMAASNKQMKKLAAAHVADKGALNAQLAFYRKLVLQQADSYLKNR
mmetsp:Transcript_7237/g.11973  ORF Transcript_7237/g.11973 Transcript_7237/m.11973 type:complete len:80 (-) Transcript_7237:94-333(-)